LTVQSSTLENSARKAAKAKNTKGNPVILPSKILAVVPNPENPNQVYVAEAAGKVKTIDLEVCTRFYFCAKQLPTIPEAASRDLQSVQPLTRPQRNRKQKPTKLTSVPKHH